MQHICLAYEQVLPPPKLHFGLYGEGGSHLHFHMLPRAAGLPTGNIPVTLLSVWRDVLVQRHLRRPPADDLVAAVAVQLRAACQSSAA